MSTAWDVSTASYTDALDISGQQSGVSGLTFNNDGTKMFVAGYGGGYTVDEWILSTAWDVSTASHETEFSLSGAGVRGLTFNNDGTEMYVTDDGVERIYTYDLSTGFDLSTAGSRNNDSINILTTASESMVRGVRFNDDGTKLFANGFYHNSGYDSRIYEYNLSTAYDVATATLFNTSLSFGGYGAGEFEDMFFSGDGTKMYLMDNADNTIDQYTIMGGWDGTDKAYVAVNADMDGSNSSDAPTIADDHYLIVTADTDGDGNLYEQGDVFDLDKIFIADDSENFLTQDSDASGDYYFKITPVTYANSSWNVETDNTVTLSNTTRYNDYLDLTSNTDFDDINYAIIETESALISEVIASY